MKYFIITILFIITIFGCQLGSNNDKVTVETKLDSVIQSYDSINKILESEIHDTLFERKK